MVSGVAGVGWRLRFRLGLLTGDAGFALSEWVRVAAPRRQRLGAQKRLRPTLTLATVRPVR